MLYPKCVCVCLNVCNIVIYIHVYVCVYDSYACIYARVINFYILSTIKALAHTHT